MIVTIDSLYEQYVIYDFNSFMADWGGYMGLALGYSLLAIYDDLVKMVMVILNTSLWKGMWMKFTTMITKVVKNLGK